MSDNFDMQVIDARGALGVIVFRDDGDRIVTEVKAMSVSKLELAKLCIGLGRALKAQHDEANPEEPT